MRRLLTLMLLATAAAACSKNATGPKGLDPTVLVLNQIGKGADTVVLTWWDQSGQVSTFRVADGQSLCTHFTTTLTTDSVRFFIAAGDADSLHGVSTVFSPWFDPQKGPSDQNTEFWTLTASGQPNGSPNLLLKPDSAAPC